MAPIAWRRHGVNALAVVVIVSAAGVAASNWSSIARQRTNEFRLDALATGIDFQAAQFTLILMLRQDCPACAASMPFYQRLTARAATGVRDVQIVAVAPPRDVDIDKYLSGHGVKPDAIVNLSNNEIPVSGTPTLLLVDALGFVKHAWVGVLTPAAETDLLEGLFGDEPS